MPEKWKICILPIHNVINYLNDCFWFELWHFNVDKKPLLKIIQSFSSAIFFLVAYLRSEQCSVYFIRSTHHLSKLEGNAELKKKRKRMKYSAKHTATIVEQNVSKYAKNRASHYQPPVLHSLINIAICVHM